MVVVGTLLLAACGGDEETKVPTVTLESPPATPELEESTTLALPGSALPFTAQTLIPCHIDLAAAAAQRPAAEATPEVIRIQILDHPYRMIPENVVLVQNRWYQLEVTTESEWHSFAVVGEGANAVVGVGTRIDYEIPPGGKLETLFHTTNIGTFTIEDNRHRIFMHREHTVTVIPEGASAYTWDSEVCGRLHVHVPTLDAQVSAPLVIQGMVGLPPSEKFNVSRIEAWSEGEQVGVATGTDFVQQRFHIDFGLTIPTLGPGAHSLLLIALQGNGKIAAAASFPVTILPDPADTSASSSYRGNIDVPFEDALYNLPLSIQGWVVIPGSAQGSGVASVEIWNGPREDGQFLTEATYGIYRPDVAEALDDPRFATSGFAAQLSNLPAGPVELFVYVRDRASGEYVSPGFLRSPLSRRVRLAEGKVTDAAWPVALAAAPDGRLFYAELLTGNIRVVQDGALLPNPFATLEDVAIFGESGLLGLALHPDFPQTPYIYAMYVVEHPETGLAGGQRVIRFRDANNVGEDYTIILDNLPAAIDGFHYGGRIGFGPDGKLYLTIGDTNKLERAQDPTTFEGSILRLNPDGSIPADNPLPGSPVYAYGLRNVFGFAFQPSTGSLYATDNGPGGFDEVNKIEAGRNYGWPIQMGEANVAGFNDPIAVYGLPGDRTIGPTGVAFVSDRPDLLLFCAYNDFFLRALRLSGPDYTSVESESILSNNCALDVTYSSDGWLYYSSLSAIYRARLDDLLHLQGASAAQ